MAIAPDFLIQSLDTWVDLMMNISDNGKKEIRDFAQIPAHLRDKLAQTILNVNGLMKIIASKSSDQTAKSSLRDMVVRHAPSLVVNFDIHFNI